MSGTTGNLKTYAERIIRDSGICGGESVFKGTRVPVEALLNNLSAGVSLDEFLDNFPSVAREQALAVLRFSNQTLKKIGLR